MVDVHSSNYDILTVSHWSYNDIVVSIVLKFYVLSSKSFELQIGCLKSLLHSCVHPKVICVWKCIGCSDGRMMRHLFRNVLPSFSFHFKSFPKNRIEWLCCSCLCATILWYRKCRDISHSHNRVLRLRCVLKQVLTIKSFSHFLKHWDWFIKVNRNTEFSHVFPNHIL